MFNERFIYIFKQVRESETIKTFSDVAQMMKSMFSELDTKIYEAFKSNEILIKDLGDKIKKITSFLQSQEPE